jgi:glyoxylase-like metal-dependent hydrolase (beta-lactamase superfamily II)
MGKNTLQIHITNDPTYFENACTVYFRKRGPCWIIDPGLPPQARLITEHIREKSLEPTGIVLTHGHMDHIAGIDELRENLGPIPVYLAKEEWAALSDPMHNLSSRIGIGVATEVTNPLDLPPGEALELDGSRWRIVDTSGHSPGGRSFYCSELGTAFVGDALFAGSVGRVDFHHSNGDKLIRNLRENLMTLPDETRVICGHGPETTIGEEQRTNPFIIHGL